jgi:hypothetical protein
MPAKAVRCHNDADVGTVSLREGTASHCAANPAVVCLEDNRETHEPVKQSAATSTIQEIIALARLALLLPTDGQRIQGRESSIAFAGVLLLGVWISLEPALRETALAFSPYTVPDLALIALGAFALTWLLVRLSDPTPGYRRALLLTLGSMPVAIFASLAAEKLVGQWFYALIIGLPAYGLLYFALGLRALTGRQQFKAVAAGAIATTLFVAGVDYLRVNPSLWIRADENLHALDATAADWARMARVKFGQQARIDAEIENITAQASPAPELFFVGFAGYGMEQVFAREIELAASVVGSRYAAGARSLLLINDRRDLHKWPLATEPALRHSLLSLGKVMGEEDVLFLALSSHGERDAALKVSNVGMVPAKLRAESLADMLRESGIAWRVVVVSACYSGSFVDELADPRTLVITAAADDRKSFGCDDQRQLTHFGEAFYRDALRGAASLRTAFEAARNALRNKEQRAGITPSMPQASFGADIEHRLAQLPSTAVPSRP